MATYANCGACGGTGIRFEGYEPTSDNCGACNGEGLVKVTAKARKEYRCDMCREPIPAGSEYVPIEVTPWTCAPDTDRGYARYHRHPECSAVWNEVGHLYDWEVPPDSDCWRQMMERYQSIKAASPAPTAADEWLGTESTREEDKS